MKIFLYKAQPITKKESVESVQIFIDQEIPSNPVSCSTELNALEAMEEVYKNQAGLLVTALKRALPQGTRHQLLIALLKDHPNLYMGT